jgi:hypothetical protein
VHSGCVCCEFDLLKFDDLQIMLVETVFNTYRYYAELAKEKI